MKLIIGLLAAIAFVITTPISAQSEEANMAKVGPHLNLLNELSERRRPNTFFPNEQSQTYGVQVDYVNVGKGNLTFVRRDMVTVGRIPIVAARVYDSSAGDTGDFGPGWRFALAETVHVANDELLYTDESGSVEALVPIQGNRYGPSMQALSDVQGAKLTGNKLTLTIRSGWTKEFKEIDGVYRLVKVSDRNGNILKLRYQGSQLASVEGANGRRIDLARNAEGRIDAITDDQGRSVSYRYKPDGLFTVKDLGGQKWKMKYHANGQLKNITDPLGNKALKAVYDGQGRAKTANIRHRKNKFTYSGQTTSMTNGRNLITRFTQGDAGMTTKVVNAEGTTTKIILGENLLPSKLKLNGELRNKFSYNDQGQLDQMTSYQPGKTLDQSYTFDWGSGQIESMASSDGTYMEFKYDAKGRLKKKKQDDTTTRYQYHGNGDLKQVKVDGEVARQFKYTADGQVQWLSDAGVEATFDYDSIGRLEKVSVPDDEPFEYQYDSRGFRTQTIAGGERAEFGYDAAGRLFSIMHDVDGEPSGVTYAIDAANLTRKINATQGTVIDIGYDGVGNPSSYGTPGNSHSYDYDEVGRFVGVTPSLGDVQTVGYQLDESGWRGRVDSRTGINLSPEQTASAIYGSVGDVYFGRSRALAMGPVRFDASSATLQAMTNLGFVAPDAAQRAAFSRSRLDTIAQDQDERMISFNRPSSSFFLPPESNQVNCALGCNVYAMFMVSLTSNPEPGQNVYFLSQAVTDHQCNFVHNDWSWGDGSSAVSTGHNSTVFHSYSNPGIYSVVANAFCPCFGIFGAAYESVEVECASAPYSAPSATPLPSITYLPLVTGGTRWGRSNVLGKNELRCEQVCVDGAQKYRMEGDITLASGSLIEVSQKIAPTGQCVIDDRSGANITHTKDHELVHANALLSVINEFKQFNLGDVYETRPLCENFIDAVWTSFTQARTAEFARQVAHLDHNERRHHNYCTGAGNLVKEGICGLVSGFGCPNPPGNWYPGP